MPPVLRATVAMLKTSEYRAKNFDVKDLLRESRELSEKNYVNEDDS